MVRLIGAFVAVPRILARPVLALGLVQTFLARAIGGCVHYGRA